jgi:hypothetical protein
MTVICGMRSRPHDQYCDFPACAERSYLQRKFNFTRRRWWAAKALRLKVPALRRILTDA